MMQGFMMAAEETFLLVTLWVCAIWIMWAAGIANREAFLWGSFLIAQSLPYLAALITAMMNALPDKTAPEKTLSDANIQPPMQQAA